MATTQLADVYVPLTFNRRVQLAQTELNAFIQSGVAVPDPILEQRLSGGGNIVDLPQFNGITAGEPNYSTDDPGTSATPEKIGSNLQKVRSASRNNHWSTMDLARELSDGDPMDAITNRVGSYWAVDDQSRLIKSTEGVLADNIAGDSSDMLYNVATDAVGAVTDAERISGEVIARAAQTLGDHKTKIRAIAMHSTQHTRLGILGLIKEHRDDKDGSLMFETYLGYRVIVDDAMTTIVGTNRITYQMILFGENSVGWARGPVETPSEITREALTGNGGGQTILSSRVNTAFHVNGFSFESGSVAGQSPTYAELALAANWDRKVARKNVYIAFARVND